MAELQDHLEISKLPIPDAEDSAVITKEFPKWLETALSERYNHNRKNLVLIIDGLNKLDRRDNAMDLVWLPLSWPSSVRVIVSTAPGII